MNPVVSHETFFLFSSAFRRAQLEHMESWVQTSPAFFCCWKCAIFSRKISYDQECIGCTYNLTKQKRKKCICKKSRIHAGVARRPYNMEHWRHVFLFWVACLHAQATYNLELKTSCAVPEQVPDMTCRRVNWLRFHNPRPQNHPVPWRTALSTRKIPCREIP